MNYFSDDINKKIGLYLRGVRKEQNLTGGELAKILNISQQQISRYETGQTKLTFEMMDRILMTFNKSWRDLFNHVIYIYDNERLQSIMKSENTYISNLEENIKEITWG